MEMAADPDGAKAVRVLNALRTMVKLDLGSLRTAYRGD
jgi:hypothetical protein